MCINVNDTPIKFYEIANDENIKYNEIDVILQGLIKWFLAHLDNGFFKSFFASKFNDPIIFFVRSYKTCQPSLSIIKGSNKRQLIVFKTIR